MQNPKVLDQYGEHVNNPNEADVILVRLQTPYDERNTYFLESYFHQGRLFYTEEEQNKVLQIVPDKTLILVVNLERPAILTPFKEKSKAILAEFGLSDEVLADLLFGKRLPEGRLPIELPSSWDAVKNQKEDMPYDSKDPLFTFGYGLSY